MIPVKRTSPPQVTAALSKKGKDGLTERERAIGHYINGVPAKKPTYAAYKVQEVKDELNLMFKHKCAYCESEYESVAPMDVEHYRPKGAYIKPDGTKSKRGYFWLAAEWTNLLPSCIDCNRERKQFRRSDTGKIVKSKSGKANKFPLLNEANRAKNPNDEAQEEPLLLDPCLDNPALFLEFWEDGSVRPKNSKEERATAKGLNSITVFGLDREGLLRERIKTVTRLKSQMHHICNYTLNVLENPTSERHKRNLNQAKLELKQFTKAEEPYLGMIRPIVKVFNRVLTISEQYLNNKIQLAAAPNDLELQENLKNILRKIKRVEQGHKPMTVLINQVVEWLELLD